MPTAFQCPFYHKERGDAERRILCEGGAVRFPDRAARDAYVRGFCASVDGWEQCSLAVSLLAYYRRLENPQKGDAPPRAMGYD